MLRNVAAMITIVSSSTKPITSTSRLVLLLGEVQALRSTAADGVLADAAQRPPGPGRRAAGAARRRRAGRSRRSGIAQHDRGEVRRRASHAAPRHESPVATAFVGQARSRAASIPLGDVAAT